MNKYHLHLVQRCSEGTRYEGYLAEAGELEDRPTFQYTLEEALEAIRMAEYSAGHDAYTIVSVRMERV